MTNIITIDKEHIYRVDGIVVPGVSQLMQEVGLIDENVIKFADPTLGTAVHLACKYDDAETLDEESCDYPVKSRLDQWRKFRSDRKIDVVLSEKRFYSMLGFCGTIDRLIKYEGYYVLIDIKTSKVRSLSTRVQMVFYKKMLEENLGIKIHQMWEVVLLEDKYEIQYIDNYKKEEGVMRSILTIHYYKKG